MNLKYLCLMDLHCSYAIRETNFFTLNLKKLIFDELQKTR